MTVKSSSLAAMQSSRILTPTATTDGSAHRVDALPNSSASAGKTLNILEALGPLQNRGEDQAFLQTLPGFVIVLHLLRMQKNPAQAQQSRQYQEQSLQALRELRNIWPQDKINALATRLFHSALKHRTNALAVFTKSLLHELRRETAVNQAKHLCEQTQQQLAQFYWSAAGGRAGISATRKSLVLLKQTASALTALPAQSGSGIRALQSSLPKWLSQAQRYLNSVARTGQSARLPQPPVGAASAVQEAASATAKALRPPGERETIKLPRPESEVGELAVQRQQTKYADNLQKAADAVLRQLHLFPHLRGKMKKLIADAARSAGINLDHLARAVQARVSQMTAGATGGVRASGGSTGAWSSDNGGNRVIYNNSDERVLAQALKTMIDPRIELADLPQETRQALIFLVEFLFTQLPTSVVATARERKGNNEWAKSLDNPEIREALALDAISTMAFEGMLTAGSRQRHISALESLIGDGAPNSVWQPDSISDDHSFEGFADKLVNSKDPVIEQTRRALVYCLIGFYKLRSADELELLQKNLAEKIGLTNNDTATMPLPDSTNSIVDSLALLGDEGSLQTLIAELKTVLDEYFKRREMRERAGLKPPPH
jgi:hypothetical protein